MWIWVQRTGELIAADGEVVAIGYAGHGEHKNQPESQALKNRGPLPRGRYVMQPPRATTTNGPYVIRLVPAGANEMYGRSGFLIHGDSVNRPGTASNGCVILPRRIRELVWSSGDRELDVVAEHTDVNT